MLSVLTVTVRRHRKGEAAELTSELLVAYCHKVLIKHRILSCSLQWNRASGRPARQELEKKGDRKKGRGRSDLRLLPTSSVVKTYLELAYSCFMYDSSVCFLTALFES